MPRTAAKLVTYSIPGPPAKEVKLTPRNDLLVSLVGLYYLATNNIGGVSQVSQTVDLYPPEADLNQLRALIAPVNLAGGRINVQKQQITAPPIPNFNDAPRPGAGQLDGAIHRALPGSHPH